jgi:hypothetical protein
MIYLALLPNPFMNAAGSDASACEASAVLAPPFAAEAEPSHAQELDELEALIAANNASCEDDVPLFLRRARA